MNKNQFATTAVAVAALGAVLFAGCKKESSSAGLKTTFVSAETNSFRQVASHLDAGGDLYLYLSTQQLLSGISQKLSAWQTFFDSMPNLGPEQKANIAHAFDLVTGLVKDSGIEEVSGLGVSSIAIEKGLYHTKLFIHHYPSQDSGFLWKLFGERPHALDGLDLLPANTAVASFSDLDAPLAWTALRKEVGQSGFPQAAALLNQLPEKFERATGLKWEAVLNSLGGEFGLVLTLDETNKIPIPLPTAQGLEVPAPGLMLVAKVKDDTIFNRIDEALQKSGQQVIRVDTANLKMRTVPVPLPLPVQLRPTVALSDGCLFVATSDALVNEALAVKSGKAPGLKSTDEFKRLARSVPNQGNQFSFISRRFGETLLAIEKQAVGMSPQTSAAQQQWLQSFMQPDQAGFSYCVSASTDDGWLSVGNGNQQPGKVLLLSAVAVPAGIISAIAIPNFIRAREAAQANAARRRHSGS